MDRRVDPIARLIQALSRLPGIGEKSATRLAFHVLRAGPDFAKDLSDALLEATQRLVEEVVRPAFQAFLVFDAAGVHLNLHGPRPFMLVLGQCGDGAPRRV